MSIVERLLRHPVLIGTALVLGFGVQGAITVLFCKALSRPISIGEPIGFVLNALLTAMPLIALALQKRQHFVLWLASLGVSTWLAWWWLQKGIAYQRNPDGSGVDMGGAMIMLLAPFAITASCLWLNQRLHRGSSNGS